MDNKKSKPDLIKWQPMPPDAYTEAINELVHLSAKISNTHTQAGVRLAAASALPLPYVAVRTLLAHTKALELDYVRQPASKYKNAARRQAKAWAKDPTNCPEASPAEVSEIKAAWQEFAPAHFESSSARVSVRQPQLLLPIDGGGYRALTPLASAGLAYLMSQRVEAHNERCHAQPKDRGLRWINTAITGIGGTQANNVTSLGHPFKPLFCAAPVENKAIKYALHVFYHGGAITLRHTLMRQWRTSLVRVQTTGTNSADARATERNIIWRIVRDVLASNAARAETLRRCEAYFPRKDDDLLADSVALLPRGLVLPEARTAEWRALFGNALAHAMAGYSYSDTQRTASLDPAAIQWLASTIEGAL